MSDIYCTQCGWYFGNEGEFDTHLLLQCAKNQKFVKSEVDPHGKNAHEMGAKLDAGKPDMSLLLDFGNALRAVAQVGTMGVKKYARGSWLHVPEGVVRYTAADLRHLMAEVSEANDPDSGLLHAAHHAWNALARLELMLRPK